jgi:selenocysteine lyase/cysteine desulfurase
MPVDDDGRVLLEKLPGALRPRTRLIACVHASNVTGVIQPVAEVGAFARRKGIPFLVDAAQSAGALPVDMKAMKIDLLAFPGHKGLLGPLGTGVLVLSKEIELDPLRQGGTGSLSEVEVQPGFYPDRLETGSHNAPGLLGLWEGVKFVSERGVGGHSAARARAVGPIPRGAFAPFFSSTFWAVQKRSAGGGGVSAVWGRGSPTHSGAVMGTGAGDGAGGAPLCSLGTQSRSGRSPKAPSVFRSGHL